jgi:hypothetical protein
MDPKFLCVTSHESSSLSVSTFSEVPLNHASLLPQHDDAFSMARSTVRRMMGSHIVVHGSSNRVLRTTLSLPKETCLDPIHEVTAQITPQNP